jgi:hypothetical protein
MSKACQNQQRQAAFFVMKKRSKLVPSENQRPAGFSQTSSDRNTINEEIP